MDSFRAIAKRLIFVLVLCCAPGLSFAARTFQNASQALAACNLDAASLAASNGSSPPQFPGATCTPWAGSYTGYTSGYNIVPPGGTSYLYLYPGAPANNCSLQKAQTGAYQGQLASGSGMCLTQPDSTGCSMTFQPDGNPFLNRTGTVWGTHGTYTASGSTCTPGTVGMTPPASVPAVSCGGGSCADYANHRDCAVGSDGVQVCVPMGTAQSAAGGCVSSASATVCAGTPKAPSPPAPPSSPITDPATQVKASDTYVTSNGASGSQSTTVNTYGAGGSSVSSGQTTGNDGPAPASTAATPGSASGGSDCNTPPVCSGDAVMCGVLRQQWYTMCSAKAGTDQLNKDLVGDGTQTPTLAPLHAASDLNGQTVDLGDTSGADSSGMGWSTTCPLQDFTITVVGVSVPLSFKPVCDYGAWMRAFVMLLASIGYAGIMGGFKVGSIFGGGGSD